MSRRNSYLALLCALGASASMWFFFDHILVRYQVAKAAAQSIPRGNLSDLYPRWLGARELLLDHRDPYSQDVTREIQMGYYGRALEPSRPNDPKDQQGFAYPIYVVFLLAPTVDLPFARVQRFFFYLSFLLTAGSALLWLRVVHWRLPLTGIAIFVLMSISNMATVQGLKLQQISLLVAALLAASLYSAGRGWLGLAGSLLALTTIKPQLALIPIVWLFLWSLSNWRLRQRFVWAFAATMAILLLGSEALFPGWLGHFFTALREYRQYTEAESILSFLSRSVFLSAWPGNVVAVILSLLTVRLCFPLLRQPAYSPAFGECAAIIMALAILVIPTSSLYNQVLLFPGVMLVARRAGFFWARRPFLRVLFGVTAALFLWPWLASVTLTIASLFASPETLQRAWALPAETFYSFPPFLFVSTSVLLFWRFPPKDRA